MSKKPQAFELQLHGELRAEYDRAWSRIPAHMFEVIEPASMGEMLESTIKLQSREGFHSTDALAKAALILLLGANGWRIP